MVRKTISRLFKKIVTGVSYVAVAFVLITTAIVLIATCVEFWFEVLRLFGVVS